LAQRVSTRLSPQEGRKFAFTVGTAFLALAGLTWWRDHLTAAYLLSAVGAALWLAGLAVPGRLGGVYRAWMGLAHAISKVTTPVFLGVVYFIVIMPVGLVMRLVGRNPIRHAAVGDSFWKPRPERRGGLTNQF
jgi:hypothetical protein